MKFIVMSEYAELLDIAMHLKFVEGHEVLMHITSPEHRKIGEGIVEKVDVWEKLIGQGYVWIVDGCAHGERQDWLRSKGEAVFGSSKIGAKLEEDRQLGQRLFKKMGLYQPESHNFKNVDGAMAFVKEHTDKKWIMKQNGDAPKSLNHKTKFDGGIDMLYHLEKTKKSWNEAEYGEFNIDLMEQVEGLECAISAFFNGTNFLKDKNGQIAGFINFEHKKECNEDLGETTGETGTVFVGLNSDLDTVKRLKKVLLPILENKELLNTLKASGFRGVFDINGCITKQGYVGFEPTMRPGIPSSSYEFLSGSGLTSRSAQMFEAVAKGEDKAISIYNGIGMVLVISAKPYPIDADLEKESTSLGEKLWIMKDGKPQKDFDLEQRVHIHPQNFYKDGENYLVATKSGYLYTVTMRGRGVRDTRERIMRYTKENTYVSGMKWRTDIGKKLEEIGL